MHHRVAAINADLDKHAIEFKYIHEFKAAFMILRLGIRYRLRIRPRLAVVLHLAHM